MGRSWCSSQLVEFHICGWKPGMLWCKSWRSESCREVYWGWVRIEDQRLVLVKGLLLCCKGHSLQLQHQIVFGWRNDKREEMHALVHLALKWAVPCLFFVKMTMLCLWWFGESLFILWLKLWALFTPSLPQPQQSLLSCSNSCPVKKTRNVFQFRISYPVQQNCTLTGVLEAQLDAPPVHPLPVNSLCLPLEWSWEEGWERPPVRRQHQCAAASHPANNTSHFAWEHNLRTSPEFRGWKTI